MLFLNFFLPAALLSNQRGFWKSKNIPIFAIYGYNVSQSMSSGQILRIYRSLEGYWNPALGSRFFSSIEKSCPQFEFLDKNWLEFLPEGQILSFFGTWVFAKMLKKNAWHIYSCASLPLDQRYDRTFEQIWFVLVFLFWHCSQLRGWYLTQMCLSSSTGRQVLIFYVLSTLPATKTPNNT